LSAFFDTQNQKGGDRMKVKVVTAFNDRQNGYVTRPVNEVFECSESRAKDLQIALLSKR